MKVDTVHSYSTSWEIYHLYLEAVGIKGASMLAMDTLLCIYFSPALSEKHRESKSSLIQISFNSTSVSFLISLALRAQLKINAL